MTAQSFRIVRHGLPNELNANWLPPSPIEPGDANMQAFAHNIQLSNTVYPPNNNLRMSTEPRNNTKKGIPLSLVTFFSIKDPEDSSILTPVDKVGELWLTLPLDGPAHDIHAKRVGSQERVYRTGELVRYIETTGLEFLGPVSQAVKKQGQWVAFREVEQRIQEECDQLIGPCMVAIESINLEDTNEPALIAFISASRQQPDGTVGVCKSAIPDIRSRVRAGLPSYMVPSLFKWLENFPTTEHDEVNYESLEENAKQCLWFEFWEASSIGNADAPRICFTETLNPVVSQTILEQLNNYGMKDIDAVLGSALAQSFSFHFSDCSSAQALLQSYNGASYVLQLPMPTEYTVADAMAQSNGSNLNELHHQKFDISLKFHGGQDLDISSDGYLAALIQVVLKTDTDGQLTARFSINQNLKHQDRLRNWARLFTETLSVFSVALRGASSSIVLDTALAQLSNHELEAVLNEHLPAMELEEKDVADIYACCPLQEGILLNTSSSYSLCWIWRCAPNGHGKQVSATQLSNSWMKAVKNHSILATVFCSHPEKGGFLQLVLRGAQVSVSVLACSDGGDPVATLEEMDRRDITATEPQVCVTICQSDTGEIACRFDVWHTLFDASSLPILLQDVTDIYHGRVPLPSQPFNKVIRHLQSIPKSQTVGFWTKFLTGVATCNFPILNQACHENEAHDSHGAVVLPQEPFVQATKFCQRNNITRSVLFHIAWALVLSYYTNSDEVCFGYMVSGRDIPVEGIDRVCGPLANLLVNRVDLRRPPIELCGSLPAMLKEHKKHQHISLAEVQHTIGIKGQLFNTTINLLRHTIAELNEADTFAFEQKVFINPNEFDIVLEGHLATDTVHSTIFYNKASLTQQIAHEVGKTFVQAINHIVSLEPQLRVVNGAAMDTPATLPESFFQDLTGVEKSKMLTFWKCQFEGLSAREDPERNMSSSKLGKRYDTELKVSNIRSTNGSSTNSLVKAAWSLLLIQTSESNAACFGELLPPRISTTGGNTAALIPSLVAVDMGTRVVDFLQHIAQDDRSRSEFQDIGLHRLRQINNNVSDACNFQHVLLIADKDDSVLDLENYAEYPLVALCTTQTDSVTLHISLNETAKETYGARFTHRFAHIIQQLAQASPDGKLTDVTLASDQDLQDIWQWNATLPETKGVPVTALVHKQALLHPQSPAVHAWDGDWSYAELDQLSTHLANVLMARGVGSGMIVPLCFEKSKWMSVAMLGVIKTGAAGAGIDPNQPEARLRTIVAEMEARFILFSTTNAALASSLVANAITVGSELFDKNTPEDSTLTLPSIDPTSPLYVVFTSGSTGKPKGLTITHENYSTAVSHQHQGFGFSRDSRVFDFSSYAFDAAWFNLLHTLTSGACLCVPSDDERQNQLSNCFKKYRTTLSFLTPSVLRHLDTDSLSQMKTLLIGGEAVHLSDVSPFLQIEGLQIKNIYGPSECTPMVTMYDLSKDDHIALGRGLGVCTWVVEPNNPQRLAPVGTVGELYLEGGVVGQGYLNNPEKTAAAFIQDPEWLVGGHDGHPGRCGRVYRTGDLVRYDDEGILTFVGRKDTQVKIRGQRVELSEIEHHILAFLKNTQLLQHLDRKLFQVVVETATPSEGAMILVAFISLDGNGSGTRCPDLELAQQASADLPKYLARSLPLYMVPSAFIPLGKVPLTITGKTDRVLLRDMAIKNWQSYKTASLNTECPSVQPSNEIERELQQVWMAVLNLSAEDVCITKPFTRLGGDSITAMQVVSKCRANGIVLKVSDVLQAETIQNLAPRCTRRALQKQDQTKASAAEEDTGKACEAFVLSPIQMKFFEVFPDSVYHFNQAFILDLNRFVESATMLKALRAVVKRHGLLRARYKKLDNGAWEQYICADDASSFSYTRREVVKRSDVLDIAQDGQTQLDIVNGPVFAAYLFHLNDNKQMLVLNAHHLVVDLVSWRIIWRDIEEYLANGHLPAPTAPSFRQWCKLQFEASQSLTAEDVFPLEVPSADTDFWDLPREKNIRATSDDCTVELDTASTQLLMGSSNTSLRTEAIDIILGIYAQSFLEAFPERATQPTTVFVEGHGREMSDNFPMDTSDIVGWFTTIHPVPMPLTPGMSSVEAVRHAKDTRRKVPSKGQPYFAARYNNENCRAKFRHHEDVELLLNFGGTYQQLEKSGGLFKLAGQFENGGTLQVVADSCRRFALIEANMVVQDGKLVTTFTYNRTMKFTDRLKQWFQNFNSHISKAVRDLAHASPALTLSDIPLLRLSDSGLATMNAQLLKLNIPIESVADIYPTTTLQEGILLSSVMGRSSYATFWVWDCIPKQLTGSVSVTKLASAWKAVVSRHSILSTVFLPHSEDGGFVQLVLKQVQPRIEQIQTRDKHPNQVLYHLDGPEFAPYEPFHAFTICQDDSGNVACRLDINHCLIDGMSLTPLIGELIACYDRVALSPVVPFGSYMKYIGSIPKQKTMTRWVQYLEGVDPCCVELSSISTNRDAAGPDTFQYANVPDVPSDKIMEFCKGMNITRAAFIQVAWAMLLSELCDAPEVCFGYLASGRNAPIDGTERIIGPLANMIISRIRVDGEPADVLKTVASHSIDHFDYQHVSLAEIQHALGLSGKPLFNTAVTIREGDKFDVGDDRSIGFKYHDHQDPHEYDLLLSSRLSSDDTTLAIQFDDAKVTPEYAEQVTLVLSNAINILLAAGSKSSSNSEKASLYGWVLSGGRPSATSLDAADLKQIWAWNASVPETSMLTTLDLIENNVQNRPNFPAICAWDGEATYAELDNLASRLAHHLSKLGLGSGSIVPLCFEKSMWCAVAMLAVMKTGAASVIMDMNQPKGRLQAIVSQVDSAVLLTSAMNEQLGRSLNDEASVVVVCEETLASMSSSEDSIVQRPKYSDLAYMVFTSGSTGTPKGTMLTHGNISTGILHQQIPLGLSTDSRVFDFASYSFDVAWCNFFHALTCGGCLCIPSESDRRNRVEDSFTELRANYAHITPTLLRCLDLNKMKGISVFNLSGEAVLSIDRQIVPDHVRVVNAYGPAETNVVTVQELFQSPSAEDKKDAIVSIGRGTGVCTWVVDSVDGQGLVPVGDIGELWIEGPLVGKGYFKDQEKTEKCFIKDPEWLRQGFYGKCGRQGTLYRTGDLVFYRDDGTLVYMGRKDTQVKIRGQRVELGEIECQLRLAFATLNVRDAKFVVDVTKPKLSSQSVLTVFICIHGMKTDGTGDARNTFHRVATGIPDLLADTLPPYMIPTVFMFVDEMPQTVSGKTDRRKLKEGVSTMTLRDIEAIHTRSSPRNPPRTTQEKLVQSLWAKVLNMNEEDISASDVFFRIGGDSLGAMRLVSLARSRGVFLSVGQVFQHPMLSSLAKLCETQDEDDAEAVAPFSLLPDTFLGQHMVSKVAEMCSVSEDDIVDILPCTTFQSNLMERTRSTKDKIGFTTSHCMKLHQDTDVARFRRAWDTVVSRAAILRTRMIDLDNYGLVQVVLDTHIEWAYYKTIEEQKATDMSKDRDMGPGTPLLRFSIVDPGNGAPRHFVIQLHWATYDGWAIRMMFAEAERLYRDLSWDGVLRNMSSFVQYIGQIDKPQAMSFWRKQFSGYKHTNFPQGKPVSKGTNLCYERYKDVKIPINEALLDQHEFTPAMVVRAALGLVIANTNRSDDATFGATVIGRQASVQQMDRMAGPAFVTLPIRIQVNRDASARELLSSVQDQATAMIPHEQVSLADIRQVSEEAAQACGFRTFLVIQSSIKEGDPRHRGGAEVDGVLQSMYAHELVADEHALIELGQRTGDYAIYIECKLGALASSPVGIRVRIDTEVVSKEEAEKFAKELVKAVQWLGKAENADAKVQYMGDEVEHSSE